MGTVCEKEKKKDYIYDHTQAIIRGVILDFSYNELHYSVYLHCENTQIITDADDD